MDEYTSPFALSEEQKKKLTSEWSSFHNILIVAGQHEADEELMNALSHFFSRHNIPVAGDIISNLHGIEKVVRHADTFLGQASADVKKTLRPDLLITFGKSIISKNLKLFLRKYSPKVHWHIQPAGIVADTFQSITNVFNTTPANFFRFLGSIPNSESFENQKQNNFNKLWEVEERRAIRTLEEFFPQDEFAELELVHTCRICRITVTCI
jgi:2-succinyl-5-enolpyruvyl-6-hydroxy-3-cyclohexene-1-carboxylate synthase